MKAPAWLSFARVGRRNFGSSYLTKKLKTINDRALRYHEDYIKSLDILEGKNRSVIKEIFPNKKSEINELFFKRCGSSTGVDTSNGVENLDDDVDLLDLHKSEKLKYQHEMKSMTLDEFGIVRVVHNDILEEEADCMLIPMVSNFVPLSGFGAYVLHRGGRELVKEIFITIKTLIKKRIDVLNEHREEYLSGSQDKLSSEKEFKKMVENAKSLQVGDVILCKPHNVSDKVKLLAFLIMPYFWQGNNYVSSNKLRYSFASALKQLNELCISSVILPDMASGIYGYAPSSSSHILLDEAVQSILQIGATVPLYNLNSISIVDKDINTCRTFSEALEDVSRNYLPHKKVLPAPKYWNVVNRRLLEIPSNVVYFCRKQNKISFRKYHGIIRRKFQHYYSNIRPFKWRASRVIEPNPFLLYQKSGEPSSYQYGPKPYYYKGVSHTLYNIGKKGLLNIRVGRHGRLQALKKVSSISLETKPRL
ncbi:conserved Plasmodium protein, unknown function [Plasmodium knowlesi strain H]|uniref:Macro domain-containing protein n=3 Tax=Plasmodium knowlesi TaxID=5850 RepID=A0A5K1UKV4_PLAKH|nr:uncharacterized protein PKNH_1414900 [Plasmodium knowlesi strain H]OTN64100.1 Uncharacterized protein PKNOH_S140232700 [Plasmodium knowlesi]CAA9990749.1 MACRO domain-containing protein, putative [Plasmodium knowlesi strain H]SBO21159.1 conserved Plasmodium protein, unknown function [Plasmodium knowlesi strain H]SBO21619.1 conserved Plasmodium protein, unknown function [Plasmodium knowlesi strain H]VVS80223.1 MACRO domain-containing protein, putative [Plasmodium knowlesi strain H]|eukprot:XP_002262038.1 [Plasmodium knowlesi strain H]